MLKTLAAAGFLALNFYVYNWFATEQVTPPRQSFASFPLRLDEWSCDKQELMDPEVERNLGATDYLICNYRRGDSAIPVDVYVGYHATQVRKEGGGSGENAIHPPAHCLPGSGWDIIAHQKVLLDLEGLPQRPAEVNRLVIARGDVRQLVYYWYQERGRVTADDWKKIVLQTWDRARTLRTDGALVRFTTPVLQGNEDDADERIRQLASEVLPRLSPHVPE